MEYLNELLEDFYKNDTIKLLKLYLLTTKKVVIGKKEYMDKHLCAHTQEIYKITGNKGFNNSDINQIKDNIIEQINKNNKNLSLLK